MKTDLHVSVYRAQGSDCTLGDASSKFNEFTLLGEGVEGPFEPDATTTGLVLVRRKLWSSRLNDWREYLHAEPLKTHDTGKWHMFGGNFVKSSDSRFPCDYPIAIHDRFEG